MTIQEQALSKTNIHKEHYFDTPCLLYDNECALCRRFKESLERIELKEKLHFYPIQEKAIYKFFPFINEEDAFQEIHLIIDPKKPLVLKSEQVIKYLTEQNSKVRKFSWLIESEIGQKATNIFYRSINKYRETLRKQCPKCRVKPTN